MHVAFSAKSMSTRYMGPDGEDKLYEALNSFWAREPSSVFCQGCSSEEVQSAQSVAFP